MRRNDLSGRERAILEAIVARLIPSDETGPGAREAGVVEYIERSLARAYERHRPAYADGLASLADFPELPAERQDAILGARERQGDPFFELVRGHAIEGMFCDPSWGGNAGGIGWDMLGYPGPRREWTAADQELEVDPRPEEQP